jgi:hypothetical protein
MSDVFEYSKEETYERNLTRWRILNAKERRAFNEPELSEEESQKKFDELHGHHKNSFKGWVLGRS